MAFVPGRELAWVIGALDGRRARLWAARSRRRSNRSHGRGVACLERSAALSLRHLGLVAGLLVLTPVLAGDLAAAGDRAQLRGVSVILDSPVPASSKLRVAIDLAPVLGSPPSGGLPDFTEALRSEPARVAGLGAELDRTVAATVTRGFRRTFVVAAIFALLALVPVALISRRRGAASGSAPAGGGRPARRRRIGVRRAVRRRRVVWRAAATRTSLRAPKATRSAGAGREGAADLPRGPRPGRVPPAREP